MQESPALETGFREDHSAPLHTSKHKQMLPDHSLMNDKCSPWSWWAGKEQANLGSSLTRH